MKFVFALLLTLVGCASSSTPLPTPNWVVSERTNRASMPFEVEGVKYVGTGVIQRKSSQKIVFTLPRDTLKLMITSCNREEFVGNPDWSKPFTWTYVPLMYLENLESCLVIATAITKQGDTYTAILDFTAGEDLPGTLKCNGQTLKTTGVGFCQSRSGLLQALDFDVETIGVAKEGCPPLEKFFTQWGYQFRTAPGFCAYRFLDKSKRVFRLTTYGYESIGEIQTPGGRP